MLNRDMRLKKINSLKIKKDTYILNVLEDKIVTNDEYQGLLIFEESLKLAKEVRISINELLIYSSFKNQNQLLLYCPESECLVYVNVENYSFKVIYFEPELFGDIFFSKLYLWKKNEIFLTTYEGELFKVSIDEGTITKVTFEQIKHISQKFNSIYLDSSNRPISFYNQNESVVLSDDYDTQILTIFDYQNKAKKTLYFPLKDMHDFMYQNGNVLLVHEDQLELITAKGVRFIEKMDKPTWIFLRAQFLSDNSSFVTLLADQSNPEMHELRIYEF